MEQVAGGKKASFGLEYEGHHIQAREATLLLVPQSGRGTCIGTAVTFHLEGCVTGAKPQVSTVNVGPTVSTYLCLTVMRLEPTVCTAHLLNHFT